MISGGNRYPWSLGVSLFIGLVCQTRPELDRTATGSFSSSELVFDFLFRGASRAYDAYHVVLPFRELRPGSIRLGMSEGPVGG